jgi:TetR/AcrR family tetracycline transcriptional repressor
MRLANVLDPGRHPHVLDAIHDLPAPYPEEHFDHGLWLIITGVRNAHGAG